MRRLAFVVLVACGGGGSSSPTPVSKPVVTTAKTDKWIVVSMSRVSGKYEETRNPDGSITAMIDILNNGRGPHVDAKLVFDPDGTLRSYEASGHHEMGTKSAERFTREPRS